MTAALLGRKVGMTQVHDDRGTVIPVTVIQAGPCTVLAVKRAGSDGKDGYGAVQLGYQDVKPHRSTLPMIGHAARAGTGPKRFVKEIRVSESADVQQGDVLTVEVFESAGTKHVDVIGTTKGLGYTGVMKRYGFGGQPASHGTERKHRSPGGIGGSGASGEGQAIKKGKKMSGHKGHVQRTARNLPVVSLDKERDLIVVKGSVPGPNGGLVVVRQAKTKP